MNRFLKKEWENFETPESDLRRSREAAWSRLQHPRRSIPLWWLAPGLAAAAVMLLWFAWPVQAPGIERKAPLAALPFELPAETPIPSRIAEAPRNAVPAPPVRLQPGQRMVAKPLPTATAPPPESGQAAVEPGAAPERVVMNFQLPRSGVRMIWIADENFTFGGDQE